MMEAADTLIHAEPEVTGPRLALAPPPSEAVVTRPSRQHAGSQVARRRFDRGAIRALDVVVALGLLIAMLPLVLLAAIAILLDSPGPVFFRSERRGYRGRPLRMLKFRKMQDGATGRPLTLDDDPRLTRIGAWLARTKVDEIPQLWHVVRGDMSLVGPRPEDPAFADMHPAEYRDILSVRPGVTGLSQLAFAEESRILDDDDPLSHYLDRLLPQKMALDRLYAERQSLGFNLAILFWTFAAVLLRHPVAVHRGTGRMRLRKR
jgi:lipopolysaccharide/colanic/teichoic acid biosynthesis glycosyltransferase